MKTFAMIKPDAVRTCCIGQVLSRIGMGMPNNAVHGSDSPESAEREVALFRTWV